MSRSRKKNPGSTNVCCKSQKAGKKMSSRRFRRAVRELLQRHGEEAVLPMTGKALTDEWDLGGDGKQYWKDHDDKFMRK